METVSNQGGAMPTVQAGETACLVCGVTVAHTRGGLLGDRDIPVPADYPYCYFCHYNGRAYAHKYESVIVGCRAFGVTLDVWQTGGGCMNFAVADDIGGWSEVLLGLLGGDLADDELGVDVYTEEDYEPVVSSAVNAACPPPETRTVDSVVSWIVSVVRWLRENPPLTDDVEFGDDGS